MPSLPSPGKMKLPKAPLPPGLEKPPKPGENGERPTIAEGAQQGGVHVTGWIDERTGGSAFLRGFLFRKVPKGTNWYYTLGSATMFAFISQAVTGVILAMYYDPNPVNAYDSMRHVNDNVPLGQFVHAMHKWGASVMIVLLFVHMARTFVFGAYKYPREMNWVIGVVLLVLTMIMGLTGYLLPFDQRAFWATVVGVNINGTGPILGPYLADFLRGGAEFNAVTLSRFYALHMMVLPGLIAALIGAHLYLVAKLGTSAPPWLKISEKKKEKAREVRI